MAGMEPTVEKSGHVYSDVGGNQAHSGLLNGCRASHSRSELLLDLGEKGVYSSGSLLVELRLFEAMNFGNPENHVCLADTMPTIESRN